MCRQWLNRWKATFPLKIFGDASLEKNFDKFASVHDVLGNEVNIPVSVVSQILIRLFFLSENFPEICQVDWGSFTSIETVAVDV